MKKEDYTNSPVQTVNFSGVDVFIKRDDLLSKDFSGNKARKFHYFLNQDFKNIDKIISFGSAQANSLYSLSVLAKIKAVKLDFYVKHISSYLKENPDGNYKAALENGANIIEMNENDLQQYIENNILENNKNTVFIEEGGRVQEAAEGIKILADEILEFAKEKEIKDLKIFLPSGTGTTALFLQKFLPYEVLTVPCVGNKEYLKEQFLKLNKDENKHPKILQPKKKYHFGKLYDEFYEIQKELLKETGIEFDFLYDSLGWQTFRDASCFNKNNFLMYIHQGGLLGNKTMMLRYNRRYKFKK